MVPRPRTTASCSDLRAHLNSVSVAFPPTALPWAQAQDPSLEDALRTGRGPIDCDCGDDQSGRLRLGNLDPHLHCSIIGTCLSTGELRKLMRETMDVSGASDLAIHQEAVRRTGSETPMARRLHKALDRRHAAVVQRFERLRDAESLEKAWKECLQTGDVPGAYWALMTQRRSCPGLRQRAFGDVHMLSHLVGAANRADIRRLVELDARMPSCATNSIAHGSGRPASWASAILPGSTAAIRELIESAGGELRSHDGGIEHRKALLAPALAWSELVVFPVDCVDHASARALKRDCNRHVRPYLPLRSASVASFIAAVTAAAKAGEGSTNAHCFRLGP